MADPTLISWQFLDDTGRKRAFVEFVNSTATPTSLQAYITAHAPHIDAFVGAQIIKVSVTSPYTLPAVKPSPIVDHPNSHGGLLKFSVAGTAHTFGLWVPAVRQTEVHAGQITDTDQTADYLTSYLGGEGSVTPQDAQGRNISAFLGGQQRDRK